MTTWSHTTVTLGIVLGVIVVMAVVVLGIAYGMHRGAVKRRDAAVVTARLAAAMKRLDEGQR